jgi:Fic family protein
MAERLRGNPAWPSGIASQPLSPAAVPRFSQRFEEVHSRLGKAETVLAAAAAHHRLVWIQTLLDGNGRVARLMSSAVLLEALDTGAVWSIGRGLARSVGAYGDHLAACNPNRRNDLDGRGHLSEESLAELTRFFLAACIDQVSFMESLMQPIQPRTRILMWAEEQVHLGNLPRKSGAILEALLYRGELPRAETSAIVDSSERSARRVVAALAALLRRRHEVSSVIAVGAAPAANRRLETAFAPAGAYRGSAFFVPDQ